MHTRLINVSRVTRNVFGAVVPGTQIVSSVLRASSFRLGLGSVLKSQQLAYPSRNKDCGFVFIRPSSCLCSSLKLKRLLVGSKLFKIDERIVAEFSI